LNDTQGIVANVGCKPSLVSLKRLSAQSQELMNQLDNQVLLQSIIRMAQESLSAGRGEIDILDEHGEIIYDAVAHLSLIKSGTFTELSELVKRGLAGWFVENRQVALIFNTQQDTGRLPGLWESREDVTCSAINMPLISAGKALGALTLSSSQFGHLNEMHKTILLALAIMITNINNDLEVEGQKQAEAQ
jgi:hypothetical protein